jgi:hypothetical protein
VVSEPIARVRVAWYAPKRPHGGVEGNTPLHGIGSECKRMGLLTGA